MPETPSFDLSKAIKLKDVVFNYRRSSIQWVTTTIKTIKSKNLQQIVIFSDTWNAILGQVREAAVRQEWQDLDYLLLNLWTSHSVRPVLMYRREHGADNARGAAQMLLPDMTRRGIIYVDSYG